MKLVLSQFCPVFPRGLVILEINDEVEIVNKYKQIKATKKRNWLISVSPSGKNCFELHII